MAEPTCAGLHILIVEDEYMIADELRGEFENLGAIVMGPSPTVARAMSLIDDHVEIDCAVLDVNLGGEPVFPLAKRLRAHGVPIVFVTGYDASELPASFKEVAKCEKPIDFNRLKSALAAANSRR